MLSPIKPSKESAMISHIEVAQGVLENEADALLKLSASLSEPFNQVIELLLSIKGRVIVSGMGKSGHVGRKIAATLASTGQPAYFVHPAEASHGDLGMITHEDLVLALSFSGETAELANLLEYTRRFKIPLVGITRNGESTLSKVADLTLQIPHITEACPLGLAPTTSTTMMMALGDAISVALLQARQFTPADFQVFHPGGSLGGQLKRVSQCMHQGEFLPLISEEAVMSQAILEMSTKGFGCVGVLSICQQLIGIITDGDLRRHMEPGLLERSVKDVMTYNPTVINEHALMSEALALMSQKKISSLFIVDDEGSKPLGIIRILDCLRFGVA